MNPTTNSCLFIQSKTGFDVFDVSLELIRTVRGPIEVIRSHDATLSTQLRKAAASVPANIREGNRRQGRDRLHLWTIAAGSADEVQSHLLVAQAWGYIDDTALQVPLQLVDRVLAMLWRLTH
ncbi:MAG: four helix bundle protein [Myxococcota bacterium]